MTRDVTDKIVADFDDIIVFLQAVAVNAPRGAAVLLSLCVENCEHFWFRRWSLHHYNPLPTPLISAL